MYDTAFPKRENEIKTQHLQSSWRGLQKLSKRKQRLYEKFLKKEHLKIKLYVRSINVHLKKIKKKSKTSYYKRKLKLFEGDIKKIWKIIKKSY